MTITPDQAQELLDVATPGPWRALHDQWEDGDGTPCEDFYVLGGPDGILHTEDFDPDTHNPVANTTLAAAAPDLAQTIAGMEWQWSVEKHDGHRWSRHGGWVGPESIARLRLRKVREDGETARLVRRLVGPGEEAE